MMCDKLGCDAVLFQICSHLELNHDDKKSDPGQGASTELELRRHPGADRGQASVVQKALNTHTHTLHYTLPPQNNNIL
ncbi:uncharacterized protein LOC119770642 isoform X3 [Culex quinquefasciatus]|uniref:uncharacterized protein LOC119768644 isoform X3 n=1 Tax=Culex quinquefasciatus TaxID=7176 RepID=UPI0018E2DBFF|nr:uncharacterized protein LOC119768644 isoform X3 [Culex quinquefasciatus]XP_038121840.1 uncharacterized protein LOC119770642 isoform X3 [Culex quinquefasciatus]